MKNFKSYITGIAAAAALTFGFSACQDDFDDLTIDVPQASITANTSIAELKAAFWNEATNYADTIGLKEDGQRYIIHGRVISSDEQSNVFKSLVIQDETAALAFSIDSYNLYLNYRVGQEIVLDVTDMYIGKYAGLQQMGRPSWYENGKSWQISFSSIEYFQQHAQLNGIPEPEKIDTLTVNTFNQIPTNPEGLQKYQSQLVRFKNVYFKDGGEKKLSAYHSSSNDDQNRLIVDRNGATMTVRTSGYSTFWNQILPVGNIDIVGILSYYNTTSSNSPWQIILIDGDGIIKVGEQPGADDKPYSVEEAVALANDQANINGWVKGYIVGAVGPEVETITSNDDIQWESPTILSNTLVIAPSTDCKDITKCLVVALPLESALHKYGNLRNNPGNLGKEILIKGTFGKYMGTAGILDNTGKADEFKIEGVTIDTGEIPQGNGQQASPYNVGQIVDMNPSSTTTAVESGVWVKGYIVGSMPTGGSSTTLSGAVFGLTDAATTNLVLGPTADCTDPSKCIGIQLSTSIRGALSLANNPGNLGRTLAIKGDVMKYCGGPGIKNGTEYELGEGGNGDNPGGDTPSESTVTSLNVTFTGKTIPSDWKNIQVTGDKAWYATTYDNNDYAAMTGYLGTNPPYDSWLISPAVDINNAANKTLSFDSQVNGYGSTTSVFEVYVLDSADPATATKTKLNCTLAQAPASGYSGFVNSGKIDLSAFSGNIYIGFRYYATQDANYSTWCLDNILLNSESSEGGNEGGGNQGGDTPSIPEGGTVIAATEIGDIPGASTIGKFTIDIQKGNGATAPTHHANTSAIRLYANNTMTISSSSKMTKIIFTLTSDSKYRYTTVIPSSGEISPAQATGDTYFTWVGDASEVTFTVKDGATSFGEETGKPGQIRFTKLNIYDSESSEGGNEGGGNQGGDTPSNPEGGTVIAATEIGDIPGASTIGNFTIDIQKGNGSTAPVHHAKTSAIRLYANNTMTISSSSKMTKIIVMLASDSKYRYTTVIPSSGEISPAQAAGDTSFTWVGDASEVTFTVQDGATSFGEETGKLGQIRFTQLDIF